MNASPQPDLGGVEKKIWDLLSAHDAVAIDTLLARLSPSTSDVYSGLLNLETQNLVRQLPGNKYVRRL
jgi:predicted Rossmann fold nucleotide-binding protein DprA/Smf involved in DNA uptake